MSGTTSCRELDNALLFLLVSQQFLRIGRFLRCAAIGHCAQISPFLSPVAVARRATVAAWPRTAPTLPGLVLLLVAVAVGEPVAARM